MGQAKDKKKMSWNKQEKETFRANWKAMKIRNEIDHLESIWERFAEWEAEERHEELNALLNGKATNTSYYKEYK